MQLEPYALHGVPIHFTTADAGIAARLRRQWAPFCGEGEGQPLRVHLQAVAEMPASPALPPPEMPASLVISQGPTVHYHVQGMQVSAFFPRWGRFDIDLAAATVTGKMTATGLPLYGLFEDMILIALAPLLRRRGCYTLHAFAAALAGGDALASAAVLFIGDVGAGKTTSGLSLLAAGARLIANDSPLLRFSPDGGVEVCAYPGLISAYADSLAWFPQLAGVLAGAEQRGGSAKYSFGVEDIWPDRWQMAAKPGLLLFPQVTPGLSASELQPLARFAALQRLVGQSMEDWDRATLPAHLRSLRLLVEAAPAYILHLAPDVQRLPGLARAALTAAARPNSPKSPLPR